MRGWGIKEARVTGGMRSELGVEGQLLTAMWKHQLSL